MMTTRRLILIAALLTSMPSVADAQPQSERTNAEVLAVIDRFFSAMQRKDSAAAKAEFHPTARFYGMRQRANGDSVMQVLTIDEFAAFIARDTRPRWTERIFEPEVRVHRSLATVWAWYDFHFDRTFSHCGLDAFQLIRTPAGWKITAVSDTYETTGCPTRAPLR